MVCQSVSLVRSRVYVSHTVRFIIFFRNGLGPDFGIFGRRTQKNATIIIRLGGQTKRTMAEARPSINSLGYRANILDLPKALDWRHQDNFDVITYNSSFFIVHVEHVTVRLVKLFRDFVLMKLFSGLPTLSNISFKKF